MTVISPFKPKNLIAIACIALTSMVFQSCKSDAERGFGPYTITVENDSLLDGVRGFITKQKMGQKTIVDSAIVAQNKLIFTGHCDSIQLAALEINGVRGRFPAIIVPGSTYIALNKDTISESVLSGNKVNEDFMRYKMDTQANSAQMRAISMAMREARATENTAAIDSLITVYQEGVNTIREYPYDFILKNTDSDLSLLMLDEMLAGKTNPAMLEKIKSCYEGLLAIIGKNEINKRRGERIKSAIALMENTDTGLYNQ